MLRTLVIALLLANGLFWAWTQDPVRLALGLPRVDHREPERLAQQVNAEAISIVPAASTGGSGGTANTASAGNPNNAASSAMGAAAVPASGAASNVAAASATSTAPLGCLITDVLTDAELQAQQLGLLKVGYHTGDWIDMQRELPGRWLLYMGRFADRDQLNRKEEELRRLKLGFTPYKGLPEYTPGLTLGEFGSSDEAQLRLAQLQDRGVRTARVLPLEAGKTEHRLRLDQPGATAQRLLASPLGARWRACTN
jgi:hypothetical protein